MYLNRKPRLIAQVMVSKINLPRAAALDEGPHEGALGLDGVIKVVRRPFVHHLAQRHQAQLGMARLPLQVSRCKLFQHAQAVAAQPGELLSQGQGRLRAGLRTFCIRVESRKITPGQKACTLNWNTCSVSTRCCKHSTADHSPLAAGRASKSAGRARTMPVQRSGVRVIKARIDSRFFSILYLLYLTGMVFYSASRGVSHWPEQLRLLYAGS